MRNLEVWLLELFEDGVKMLLYAREVFVCNWLGFWTKFGPS
ncbi:putative carboxypeptidase C [Helianthus annuus]|nr:putative carboxypeptidase C [Helianthus annuus]KAJ0727100.1 putative carboxypeptidase C [Helianthus annuus]